MHQMQRIKRQQNNKPLFLKILNTIFICFFHPSLQHAFSKLTTHQHNKIEAKDERKKERKKDR